MFYRFKNWRSQLRRPWPYLLLALLALLCIPWPVGSLVRPLLQISSPYTAQRLSWESVQLRPIQGLLFKNLELRPLPGMVLRSPYARLQFSWVRLALLQTRIESIAADTLTLDWELPSASRDSRLPYAIPTESHLASLREALDSLHGVLASYATVSSTSWQLRLDGHSLAISKPRARLEGSPGHWELELHTDSLSLRKWPLPRHLEAILLLGDTLRLSSLKARYGTGSLQAQGELSASRRPSMLSIDFHDLPLEPFGDFALPSSASWKGKANGQVEWQGHIAHPKSWTAEGKLELSQVTFHRWSFQRHGLFHTFLPGFREDLDFSSISLPAFTLSHSRVDIDTLRIRSPQIQAHAQGSWTFPERLRFSLTGTLSPELYQGLSPLARLGLPQTRDGGAAFRAYFQGDFGYQTLAPTQISMGTVLSNLFD